MLCRFSDWVHPWSLRGPFWASHGRFLAFHYLSGMVGRCGVPQFSLLTCSNQADPLRTFNDGMHMCDPRSRVQSTSWCHMLVMEVMAEAETKPLGTPRESCSGHMSDGQDAGRGEEQHLWPIDQFPALLEHRRDYICARPHVDHKIQECCQYICTICIGV